MKKQAIKAVSAQLAIYNDSDLDGFYGDFIASF